jgi:hypothetical protein
MTTDLARRRSLLTAALAAVGVKQDEPELAMVPAGSGPGRRAAAAWIASSVHRWLDSWQGLGDVVTGDRDGPTGLRPGADALRRSRLARHVLRERHGALADERHGHRLRADAMARGPGGRVGRAEQDTR